MLVATGLASISVLNFSFLQSYHKSSRKPKELVDTLRIPIASGSFFEIFLALELVTFSFCSMTIVIPNSMCTKNSFYIHLKSFLIRLLTERNCNESIAAWITQYNSSFIAFEHRHKIFCFSPHASDVNNFERIVFANFTALCTFFLLSFVLQLAI